ncbi:MAG TPA: MBL fold metallo-hydrolase [Pedobacter sp.]|nr:MBL fold metallo-hydrolase [Pedobacter sp.]
MPHTEIKCFPANNGDCLLISFSVSPRKHILVDFGYVTTYNLHLKSVLEQLQLKGEKLDKVIISHIDSDHILGANAFLKDGVLATAISKEFWLNSLRHLPAVKNDKGKENIESSASKIMRDRVRARGHKPNEKNNEAKAISAEQGTTVGAKLVKLGLAWNTDFNGQAVSIENKRLIHIDDNSRIYLLSPDQAKLSALYTFWQDELTKFKVDMPKYHSGYDDAFEMLATWEKDQVIKPAKTISDGESLEELAAKIPIEDKTIINGSSIAFVLETGNHKLLMLADAHPNLILKSLEAYQVGPLFFDLIKVSHHGSFGNISIPFLEKVDSKIYLFSTNGKGHDHPDKETIAHIVNRPAEFERQLIFNYKTKNAEYFNREDWKTKYNYSIQYLDDVPFNITIQNS